MEIKGLGKNTRVTSERKIQSSRKDFSQSFSQARDRRSGEELKKMIEDIKKKGNRLVLTKTYADVASYKRMIKEYLQSVLEYMYSIKQDISFWQTQYFITVDIIDSRLEELTQMLLSDEKENINIASTVDEIQGLIVDIYR
ncbi:MULTISPECIES: YaaR family protein [Clostridium]|uniref:YaaR family protein n=1 Tax=Clostridium paridis TaxID=2803863 RepID=A0A937FF59_9CLOT|nr:MULTISPECIES: YaaR family protein [Clostridium]MBL4932063.1 YaaR family protein [Clostridium paridis]